MGWLKEKRAVVKFSFLILALIVAASVIMFASGVLANTHSSTVDVDPDIVAGGEDDQLFTVTVCNTGDPEDDDINRFSIYYEWGDFKDFTDVQCLSKDDWNGPYDIYDPTVAGGWLCLYVADTGYEIEPGECTDFEFTADTPGEECCRELRFETRDIADYWQHVDTDICVDGTDPETTKTISEPKKVIPGDDPNEFIEWINGETEITLEATDCPGGCDHETGPHDSGIDKTWYKNMIDESEDACWDPDKYCIYDYPFSYDVECINEAQEDCTENWEQWADSWEECVEWKAHNFCNLFAAWKLYDGTPITKDEESCHVLYYFSVDGVGNIEDIKANCFFVDLTPPKVIKDNGNALFDFGEPMFMTEDNPRGEFHWITSDMPIIFKCDDSWNGEAPHPAGDEELCFKVSYDYPDWGYITEDYCEGPLNDEDYCCVPATLKNPYYFYFNEDEDSAHNLEYYCEDAVEKKSDVHIQYYKVDSQPPIIEKDMFGSYLEDCPSGTDIEHGDCYVADDGSSGVYITVYDDDTYDCAVDDLWCYYNLIWIKPTGERVTIEDGYVFSTQAKITFTEDSTHELYIYCEDALGNWVEDLEYFLVDSTPPETEKWYEGPQKPDPIIEGETPYPHWITSSTLVYLEAKDEKVGVDKIYWRNIIVEDRYCESEYSGCQNYDGDLPGWTEYTGPFNKPDESCHLIEFYAVDKLGNKEEPKRQCVFVDNTPPESYKEHGDGYIEDDEFGWISKDIPIYLWCEDQGDHPVEQETIWWRFSTYTDGFESEPTYSEWYSEIYEGFPVEISFPDDCWHDLEYYCVDHLGNAEEPETQYYIVDTEPPVIEKTIEGPYKGQCPPSPLPSEDICYVDTATTIIIDAYDPEPHPVDDVECGYTIYLWENEEWKYIKAVGFKDHAELNFGEESKHKLRVRCDDALGNEIIEEEIFFVDKTAPEIWKRYGQPYFENDAEWISSLTPIYAGVTDAGDHKSGIAKVEYRTTKVDDDYCWDELNCEDAEGSGEWTSVDPKDFDEFEFYIDEDSCHLIEIYAEDNVEKNSLHKQCVFVDNQAPTPLKELNEPFTEWYPVDVAEDPFDPDATHFYPWIVDLCWGDGEHGAPIDCWKVTLDTKISMTCEDPEPHPVDHEGLCFKVEMDGEDITDEAGCKGMCGWQESYCDRYNGEMNDDGWCCVDHEIEHFYFKEESEHNLQFYCVDALGNGGPESDNWIIDEEKFKVLGKMFMIRINDKWNLISVPFVLLNDDPEEVFEDLEGLQTVWSYDENGDWHVYRPGEDGTNDLNHIIPGDGYWLLADCEDQWCGPLDEFCQMLTIGGSLYQAGPVVPPSKTLVEGWNLIGYYGTEGRYTYRGPDPWMGYFKDSKESFCALYSLRNLDGGLLKPTNWNSLIGYWEPDNPYQWDEYGLCDELDPGAGYWIAMDAEDTYNRETVCDESIFQEIYCDIF